MRQTVISCPLKTVTSTSRSDQAYGVVVLTPTLSTKIDGEFKPNDKTIIGN